MLTTTLFIALICTTTAIAVGGVVHLAWRQKIGSGQFDISGMCFDSSGHVTAAVWLQDTVDLSHNEAIGSARVSKFDANGHFLWNVSMEIPFKNVPAIALDKSDSMYVSGPTYDSPWHTAKLDKSGSVEWDIMEDTDRASPPLVAIDTSGNAYFTGMFHDNASTTMGVVKYDSNGSSRWTQVFGDHETSPVCSVADSVGNLYVVGNAAILSPTSTTKAINNKRWVIVMAKFGPNGDLLASYQSNSLIGDEYAHACAVDNADHLYIVGHSNTFLNSGPQPSVNATLMRFDQTGAPQWTHHEADLQFTAITADDQRNLYVVGERVAARSNRIVLTKFTSDGNPLWSHVVSSRMHDTVTSILVDSALHRIYMAGVAYAPDGYSHTEAFLVQLVESATEPDSRRLRRRSVWSSEEDIDGNAMVMEGLLVCCFALVGWVVWASLFTANWLRHGSVCETIDPVCDVAHEQTMLAATLAIV